MKEWDIMVLTFQWITRQQIIFREGEYSNDNECTGSGRQTCDP